MSTAVLVIFGLVALIGAAYVFIRHAESSGRVKQQNEDKDVLIEQAKKARDVENTVRSSSADDVRKQLQDDWSAK